MILKSIKWRLQLWYGLILVAVLVGFGLTAYQLERNRQFRRVDEDIHRRIGALAQLLHGPPHGQRRDPMPGEFRPPPEFPEGADDLPPEAGRMPKFTLSPQVAALFGTNAPGNFYFRVWRTTENGEMEIGRSENFRQSYPQAGGAELKRRLGTDGKLSQPLPMFNAGGDRIALDNLPSGEWITVGGSIAPEMHDLKMTALKLTSFGGVILLLGFAGGWMFVGRALRPIAEISGTATKIAAGDLSQRINTADAESELGQLAAVLNSTFARLETAFAQQKQFASDAAHELRTPVSVMLTQTQMALGRERDAAGYKQTVEACQRAAQRMRRLIESLLELARFDAGQEVLKRLRFDLAKTVAECVDLVQPLAEEKKIHVLADLPPLEIAGDSERLAQVVTNLLTNAIQYNQPGGEVRIKLSAPDGLARLEISDTGKGIAPEDLPRVFERFYRADKSRTGGGNTGLGLSICKAIVEAHGGTIEATSVSRAGTTFTVRLPKNF